MIHYPFLLKLHHKRNESFIRVTYHIFSAVAALGRIFIGPVSAELVAHFGWIDFYIFSALIGLPSLVILYVIRDSASRQAFFMVSK